ncbi:MAG: ribonuclease HI family protein [Elusimicrobiota bacterium]|jgi:ribonuclease HI|nr:ribonuclease HI family protein [Elusimicrobiota bacterium]
MELIINIDGGSRGNPGPGASAWVIKDAKGQLLLQDGLFFKQCTNNQAEFMALKCALLAAVKLKGSALKIFSDSQLLVKQYLGEYKIKNPQLKILIDEIHSLAKSFKIVNITHVPREQNKQADALCNAVMDERLKSNAKPPFKFAEFKEQAVQPNLFDLNNL